MNEMVQGELCLLGGLPRGLRNVGEHAVKHCKTEQEALRLCIQSSDVYRSQSQIADYLGMKQASFSAILNCDHGDRKRHLCRVDQVRLQQLCGNRAIDQWAELFAQERLFCQLSDADRAREWLRNQQHRINERATSNATRGSSARVR